MTGSQVNDDQLLLSQGCFLQIITSAGVNKQPFPICSATASPSDEGRSNIATLLPARANLSAVARPNPEAPPVTRLTPFCNVNIKMYYMNEQIMY